MNRNVKDLMIDVFGAMSNGTRLRIVEILLDGGKTVNEIATALGLQQSGTSQHLAILSRAGILYVEPRGASRVYRVRANRLRPILTMVQEFCEAPGPEEEEEEAMHSKRNGSHGSRTASPALAEVS